MGGIIQDHPITFREYCAVIASLPTGNSKLKAQLIAQAAEEAFRDHDPANWYEVQKLAIPVFKADPRSRLVMAPEAFDEGICQGLYIGWMSVSDGTFGMF